MKLTIPTTCEWTEKIGENGKKIFSSHYICPIHRTKLTKGICEHLAVCEQCGLAVVYLIVDQPESLIKKLNPKR